MSEIRVEKFSDWKKLVKQIYKDENLDMNIDNPSTASIAVYGEDGYVRGWRRVGYFCHTSDGSRKGLGVVFEK